MLNSQSQNITNRFCNGEEIRLSVSWKLEAAATLLMKSPSNIRNAGADTDEKDNGKLIIEISFVSIIFRAFCFFFFFFFFAFFFTSNVSVYVCVTD